MSSRLLNPLKNTASDRRQRASQHGSGRFAEHQRRKTTATSSLLKNVTSASTDVRSARRIAPWLGACLLLSLGSSATAAITANAFGALEARNLGPAQMSGRIAAIDAVADQPNIIYIGAASGGVWKSRDGGITFRPVFDEHTQSIGAIRIDPNNSERVWVGTGETWVRNSVSIGDGIYRSDNGGETWQHLGLEDSERIATIRISAYDSDTVFACVTGALWNDHPQRGVFRTRDGGESWEKVLYINDSTGCADLDLDPNNPNIVYAGMWQFRRSPDFFQSGGPGSGLYRSTDGGASWQRLSNGPPEGELGRIAVAVAPSRTGTVYANVESDTTALYRSDDMGASWREMNSSQLIQMRPFYFSELLVDPHNHERLYKPSYALAISTDGGATFSSLFGSGFGGSIHPDHHALWINPDNPKQMLLGTDGGVYETRDQAGSWRHIANLPVAQFYHVSVDQQWPYHVYGGLQDNGSWRGPSRAPGGIRNKHWDSVGVNDGFWSFPDPQHNHIVYSEGQGGLLMRIDTRLGEIKQIAPVAGQDEEDLRFNWNAPLQLSQHHPGRLYFGSQYLHVSDDRGESWRTLSPDLTTDDPQRQRQMQSGGLTIDNSTAENNATLYTISESPLDDNILWVGSDDGRIHLSRDGGANWREVSERLPGVPANTWVSRVHASPHDAATVFVTLDGHRSGDMQTYVLVSNDYGASWRRLDNEQIDGYAWVIQQDLVNPGLLFVGTERGLYISPDGGGQWARFKGNLPKVAVHDIVIHPREHDVVLATHGRGIYVIDDITPIRALTRELMAQNVALLPARDAVMVSGGALQEFGSSDQFTANNPPEAAVITYWLKKRHLLGDLKVNVYDQAGELITTLPGGKRPGINRVEWPMRLQPPKLPAGTSLAPAFVGPRVAEGEYRIELIKGKQTLNGSVTLVADPRSPHSADDRRLQQQLAMRLYHMLSDLTYLSESMTALAEQARNNAGTLPRGDARRLREFADDIDEFNAQLVSTHKAGWLSGDEQLREKISQVYSGVSLYDGRPSATQERQADDYRAQLDSYASAADRLLEQQLERVNQLLQRHAIEPLQRQDRGQWENASEGLRGASMNRTRIQQLPLYLQQVFTGL
ncbi:MAG: hypothetical protein Tsb002_22320 [Wenzhouxiangellaceae bacterium]